MIVRKNCLQAWLYFVAFGAFLANSNLASATNPEQCGALLSQSKPALFEIDPKNFEFRGVTQAGLIVLKQARDVIRDRTHLFRNDFRNLDTLHHAGLVTRLFKGHMYLYGPPGGAKTAFVNWMMRGESESPFKLQLHQMITEQALVGGQNFEAAKEGRFEVNVKGSLADYTVALIDETDKGNPSALGPLLNIMNEREINAGNKIVKARLETLFATSNSNLAELFQQFSETGQGSTAPALLNRFQFKAFIYNWLSARDQAVLDQRIQRARYLKSIAETFPEVLKDEVFLEPKELDWASLRQLAHAIIKPSRYFMTAYREFVNDMRAQTNLAIRESEQRHKTNPTDEPFVYFPSADYTERLRQQIPEIIMMSAFVDFMSSPLANDATIEHLIKNPIVLDPVSIWRGYLAMTTIGPGQVKLRLDPNADHKIDLDFDWSIDPTLARDEREEKLIKNLKDEQERFRRTFQKHLEKISAQVQIIARNANHRKQSELEEHSFEELIKP